MSNNFITNNGMWLTFDEIVGDLEVRISLADKKQIAAMKKDELAALHHGFGTQIRNSYGLWAGNPLTEQWRINPASRTIVMQGGVEIDMSPHHPDTMSMSIIEELWSRIQYLNKP